MPYPIYHKNKVEIDFIRPLPRNYEFVSVVFHRQTLLDDIM